MDPNEELSLLRKERLEAIRNCDFKKAREIDNTLKTLKETIAFNLKDDQERQNLAEFDLEKEAVMLEAEKAYSDATSTIFAARSTYQKKMVELQQKHQEELTALASGHARDLELATLREVPLSNMYRKGAQVSALIQNYDQAETLFKISQDTLESTLQERQDEVSRNYETIREQVYTRHMNEDKICEDNYLKSVDNIIRKHHETNENLRKRLEFRAYQLRISLDDVEMPIFNDVELITDDIEGGDDIELVKPRALSRSSDTSPKKSPKSPKSPVRRFSSSNSPKSPISVKRSSPSSPKSKVPVPSPKKSPSKLANTTE